jgi:hypothetical protein
MGYGRAKVEARVQQELDQEMVPAGKVKQITGARSDCAKPSEF